ncbi:hypothetical protein [Dyella mobilis]|uniref:Uncharacterized protein n=1 Tax=Dyella mobilis TaxID=1849582 RepID=A0ABS2KKE2_9GAMM|nr:hypothetical protein [Dyella mobilis]MBM7131262.1 hypothetical protein [Dyella mobilis]
MEANELRKGIILMISSTSFKISIFSLIIFLALWSQSIFATTADNQALAKLEQQDQADRMPGTGKINWDVVAGKDAERKREVEKILADGGIRTARDYFNASIIFQHGEDLKDIEQAYAFAVTAVNMDDKNQQAKQLEADAWDRIMLKRNRPQWYGTQFIKDQATGKYEMYQADASVISDAERQGMGLPTMSENQAHLDEINKAAAKH